MTQAETKKLLGYITAAYPSQFKGDKESTALNRIAVWQNAMQEYSFEAAMVAANAYIAADISGFAPAPGQIIAFIHEAATRNAASAQEAWAMVRKAVNCPWEKMQESFDSLPDAVRKAVGSAASLRELAQMDIATFESVAGSNFMRTYSAVVKREEERERMPAIPCTIRERIAAELESRRLARKMEDSRAIRNLDRPDAIAIALREPDTPDPEAPKEKTVSGDSITEGMRKLKQKLGAAS